MKFQPPDQDLRDTASHFRLAGEFVDAAPFGGGHIHDTYLARLRGPNGRLHRSILQRINTQVFLDPAALMENIFRVTDHLRVKIAAARGDPDRETLTFIPTGDGRTFWPDPQGEAWRALQFIPRTRTAPARGRLVTLTEAARAFGRFQRLLADFPASSLHVTLPDFHHTPRRFAAFLRACETDPAGRAAGARAEIEFAKARAWQVSWLQDRFELRELPLRVTHNDAKLDNILLDAHSGRGVCVIDLDTVMPGLAAFDFGDLVRSGSTLAAEDERDPSKVSLSLQRFGALARGYLAEARGFLTQAELDSLLWGTRLITFEQGLRFLSDYLNGDVYYKIQRPEHNLERCRTQFALTRDMENKFELMRKLLSVSVL